MRTAILVYVAPLTLLMLFVLLSLAVARVRDCPPERPSAMLCRPAVAETAPGADATDGPAPRP